MKELNRYDKAMRNKNIRDYNATQRELAETTSQYYPEIKKFIIKEIEKGKSKNEAANVVFESKYINYKYPKINNRDVRDKLNYIISIDKDLKPKARSNINEEQER